MQLWCQAGSRFPSGYAECGWCRDITNGEPFRSCEGLTEIAPVLTSELRNPPDCVLLKLPPCTEIILSLIVIEDPNSANVRSPLPDTCADELVRLIPRRWESQ